MLEVAARHVARKANDVALLQGSEMFAICQREVGCSRTRGLGVLQPDHPTNFRQAPRNEAPSRNELGLGRPFSGDTVTLPTPTNTGRLDVGLGRRGAPRWVRLGQQRRVNTCEGGVLESVARWR